MHFKHYKNESVYLLWVRMHISWKFLHIFSGNKFSFASLEMTIRIILYYYSVSSLLNDQNDQYCYVYYWQMYRLVLILRIGGVGVWELLHAPYVALSGNSTTTYNGAGAHSGAVGWGTVLQTGRSRIRFLMVSSEFFIDIILPAALWPWGKVGRCLG